MMNNKTILTWSLGVLALLVVVGGVYYFFGKAPAVPKYSATRTTATVLGESNQDYVSAQAYLKVGSYDLALEQYKKALASAQDQSQKTLLLYHIASVNESLGKYAEAIRGFKSIAADTTNYPIIRAGAVQKIGRMYSAYFDSNVRDLLVAETFKDAPYNSFLETGKIGRAYTKLFEYAASIYPLAYSEVLVAYGRSSGLINTLKSATTSSQGKEYLAIIAKALEATDADLKRIENAPDESDEKTYISSILVREGMVYDRLYALGVADSQRAEPYFQKAMQYDTGRNQVKGNFNTFNYAIFLVNRYGATRSADIKKLLDPFRNGNEKEISAIVANFLRDIRTNTDIEITKASIVKLSKLDADFKTYLISLGWTAADFK